LPADLFQRRASTQPIASGNFSPRIAYPQSDTVSANPRSGLHQRRRRDGRLLTVLRGPCESLSDVILRLVGASRLEKARGTLHLVWAPHTAGVGVHRTFVAEPPIALIRRSSAPSKGSRFPTVAEASNHEGSLLRAKYSPQGATPRRRTLVRPDPVSF
jgi:hypothetical protein